MHHLNGEYYGMIQVKISLINLFKDDSGQQSLGHITDTDFSSDSDSDTVSESGTFILSTNALKTSTNLEDSDLISNEVTKILNEPDGDDLENLIPAGFNRSLSETTGYNSYEFDCASPTSLSDDNHYNSLNKTRDLDASEKPSDKNGNRTVHLGKNARWVEVRPDDVLSVTSVSTVVSSKHDNSSTKRSKSSRLKNNKEMKSPLSRSMETIWRPVWKPDSDASAGLLDVYMLSWILFPSMWWMV